MLEIRNKRLFVWGVALLGVLFAADYGHGLMSNQFGNRKSPPIRMNVRTEVGAAGHSTIGIDEKSLSSDSARRFLHFSTLGQWEYSSESRPPCPKAIQELSGKSFDCVGFMYPLRTGEKIKDFCLLRSTQTCCYGPRPQFNQYILVEMTEPVKFERLSPVMVSGKLFVEPRPRDGYIYRMEGTSVASVGDDTPEVDPAKASKQAGLPLFDYAALAGMANRAKSKSVPAKLRSMSGRKVILAGYCVGRSDSKPPRLIVAKSWWDGVAQGTAPTVYNAVAVYPVNAAQAPPLWRPYQVFTGTLEVIPDRSKWKSEGIVQLHGAVLGVPGVTRLVGVGTAQFVPVWGKVAILAAFAAMMVRRKRA